MKRHRHVKLSIYIFRNATASSKSEITNYNATRVLMTKNVVKLQAYVCNVVKLTPKATEMS